MSDNKKYNIIYADPPWRYEQRKIPGGAEQHYPTMTLDDICNLPVEQLADKNCALFLWTTFPKLKEAFQVIDAWGFQYRTLAFLWLKQNRKADTWFYGITVRNTHEAIISHDIFDEVQRIRLQSRRECKEKPVNEYTPNIFKGKIFCAHCGKHLNRMCKRRITRADVYRFYCITNNRIAHGSCPGVSIREDELIPSVIAIMEKELSVALSDSLPTLKAEMTQQTERAEIQTQLSLKRQDLANSQRLIRGLYEDVVQGLLSSEDYFSMKEGYEQRVEQLTAEITALNNRIVEFDKQLSLYQDMHNDALTLESNHTLTAELIDRLIERIEVNHDKELTIVFRFQTDYAKVVTE